MRVGLFINKSVLPTGGGGFTFQQEIFQALLELVSQNQNQNTFTVFIRGKFFNELAQIKCTSDINFISLEQEYKRLNFLNFSLVKILSQQIKNSSYRSSQSLTNRFRFELNQKILTKYKIDITLSLRPETISFDTPYIVPLWDLAHRYYPFFPEVSSNGKWYSREYAFTTLLRRAAFVITGTEVGKREIIDTYQVASDRIRVLPFPTPKFSLEDTLYNYQEKIKKYQLEKNSYLFYPAQFWPHKNHANLIYAVKLLNDSYGLKFSVVLTGSDKINTKVYLKNLVEDLNLKTQVYFLNFVDQEDLIALYKGAFALTFMSFFGPDNLPPLEAFALGCPVIASNISGAQEQLGDAALLVNPSDEKEIALAIKSLYDNPGLVQTLVQRGYERATQWTGKDYVRGIFKILEEFEPIRRCWGSGF